MSLAYRYYRSLGVKGNCSASALYYKNVGDYLYTDSNFNRSSLFIFRNNLAEKIFESHRNFWESH